MKTLKVMSIVGLVWFGLSLVCLLSFNNYTDYESSIGWGILGMFYAIPYSIVVLVNSKKLTSNN